LNHCKFVIINWLLQTIFVALSMLMKLSSHT